MGRFRLSQMPERCMRAPRSPVHPSRVHAVPNPRPDANSPRFDGVPAADADDRCFAAAAIVNPDGHANDRYSAAAAIVNPDGHANDQYSAAAAIVNPDGHANDRCSAATANVNPDGHADDRCFAATANANPDNRCACLTASDLPVSARATKRSNTTTEEHTISGTLRLRRELVLSVILVTSALAIASCNKTKVSGETGDVAQPARETEPSSSAAESPSVLPEDTESSQIPNVAASTPTPAKTCRITVSALNVRHGPSVRYLIVGGLMDADTFAAEDRLSDCSWVRGSSGDMEGWVASAFLDCTYDPCTLPVSQSIPPTYTPSPTPMPTPTLPASIHFAAEQTELKRDECTVITWVVTGIQEVYFDGEGVVGEGSREVCPSEDTVYELRWLRIDGVTVSTTVQILVSGIEVDPGIPIRPPPPGLSPLLIPTPGLTRGGVRVRPRRP